MRPFSSKALFLVISFCLFALIGLELLFIVFIYIYIYRGLYSHVSNFVSLFFFFF